MTVTHFKHPKAMYAACACSQPTSRRAVTTDDWAKVTCKRCLTHKPASIISHTYTDTGTRAAIDAIRELVRTSPSFAVEHAGEVRERQVVRFGYIGNVESFCQKVGGKGDYRRWCVWTELDKDGNLFRYAENKDGSHTFTFIAPGINEGCPWSCESRDLTVEALRDAWRAVKAAIRQAQDWAR